MTNPRTILACTACAVIVMVSIAAPETAAQTAAPRAAAAPAMRGPSFGWFAELVSFDAATRTMTVKARIEPHVAQYTKTFAPGDRLVLTWTQFSGNADAVTYVASENAMTAKSGYVVRGTFVSADANAKTLTFALPVPATAAPSLAAAKPGTPIRVGAPMLQPGPEAVLTTVALNKSAPPRPAPVAPKAPPIENARQVAGDWQLDSNLMGNAVKLECSFTQAGKKIAGVCRGPGPLGNPAVTGAVEGDDVAFQFEVAAGGVSIALRHAGKLNDEGNVIQGTLNLMGTDSPFKATKQ